MNQLKQILFERLEKKGIKGNIIPGFMSNLANTILANPQMNHLHINKRLHLLGWDGFELDYHTLQLATAFFEAEGMKSIEFKTGSIV